MAYITREDGEHFVIPSYRDVLSAKNKNALKKEIQLLSQSYGEYITLQRKSPSQYEVAFSPDTGYLLGESIWHQFRRPPDMVYCERIPNTTEAILVIVKAGSVYLDGSFPLESIPEELVIFLTQQNNFEVYIYGDVPISQKPEEGKFSFDENSVKSFAVLEEPVFPKLPLLKIYQLQLVDPVLKAHGIGVFPFRQVMSVLVFAAVLWVLYSYFTSTPEVVVPVEQVNPYQGYYAALLAPDPTDEVHQFVNVFNLFYTMPGWIPRNITYSKGTFTTSVASEGGKVNDLIEWGERNGAKLNMQTDGFYMQKNIPLTPRTTPTEIYPVKEVMARLVDNLASVYPGNQITISNISPKGVYVDMAFLIRLNNLSPSIVKLIGDQFRGLPLVVQNITANAVNGNLSGTINMEALGSQL